MTDKIEDGGPAFPPSGAAFEYIGVETGMSLRDWFATHAPEPSKDEIDTQFNIDMQRNPHNDYYKPERRSKRKIIADLKYAYADAMLAARKAGA